MFVDPNHPFPYTITFENESDATAPAQVVTITQTLDSNLDLSTFQLGSVGFGSTVVQIPAGRTSFSGTVDVTATLGVLVKIDAGINLQTGVATWTFSSLDPRTQEPPQD